jgi:hypothetical protein
MGPLEKVPENTVLNPANIRLERPAGSTLARRVRHLQTNQAIAAGPSDPARAALDLNLQPQIIPIVIDHAHAFRGVIGLSQGRRRPGGEDCYELT